MDPQITNAIIAKHGEAKLTPRNELQRIVKSYDQSTSWKNRPHKWRNMIEVLKRVINLLKSDWCSDYIHTSVLPAQSLIFMPHHVMYRKLTQPRSIRITLGTGKLQSDLFSPRTVNLGNTLPRGCFLNNWNINIFKVIVTRFLSYIIAYALLF